MAALSVRYQCEDRRDSNYVESKIQKWRIGLDDIPLIWERRCASSCNGRDLEPSQSSMQALVATESRKSEVWSTAFTLAKAGSLSQVDPPPSYYDSILDQPPLYDPAADLATVLPGYKEQAQPPTYEYIPEKSIHQQGSMTAPTIDFDDTSTFRQAAGKKAKKAQQQADKAKWADDGDEGNKEGDGGEQNGGNGGGSNNGDGGAGDGGGGGDDWGNWDTGNKKKKGKKAKEEEKKKQEEEEEKKKQEEEAASATNPLSWADDTNGDLGDDWGGFTATTKKDKKGKKGKVEPVAEKPNGTSNFDNIDLNDDAPQLDLDFGTTEKKDSGFGFGGWGATNNTWNAGNTWSFANDTGTTDIADSFTKATTTDTGDSWSFGGNKKNKKKTTGGFDFGDFGTVGEEKEEESKADETGLGGDDGWGGGFTATGKKGKKDKKKSMFGDVSSDPDPGAIGTAIAEVEPAADDSWNTGWGAATTKSKKKGKKAEEEAAPPPPPPAPVVPVDTFGSDDWGGFGSKKDKKKGKKIAEVEEPAITVAPEPDEDVASGWGSIGQKSKKKGSKKEPEKIDEPEVTILPEPDPQLDFGWGGPKANKKKGLKEDKISEPAIAAIPDPEPEADTGWGGVFGKKGKKGTKKVEEPPVAKEPDPEPKDDEWSAFGSKKDKKKKNSLWDEPNKEEKPLVEDFVEADAAADPGFGVFGTKKKKGKKGLLDDIPAPPPEPEPVEEEKPSLARTGSKKDKKGKKGLISEVKDDPVPALDSKAATDAATSVAADDDWMSGWGATDKKKDKKGKRNSMASSKGDDAPPQPPPIPAVPDVPDASSFDIWGSAKKDKDKKGKKGKITEPEPDLLALDDPIETKNETVEDEWAASIWGLSTKDKKKKEKEREKAKKDKEEKEKQEKEEQERREEEERVAREKEEEEKAAKAKEKPTAKGKAGKKGKTTTSPEVSKTKDLLADSVPDIAPTVEEDSWGSSWGVPAKGKKKGVKKEMEFDLPPPAPTPPAQGLTPEPEEEEDAWGSFAPAKTTKGKKDIKPGKKGARDALDDVAADEKPDKDELKKKASTKEETPAKVAKSFWGGMTATSASKTKPTKAEEKAKKEAEAAAAAEAEIAAEDDYDPDEIVEIIEEPTKKSAKDKTGAKLSKTLTKDSEKLSKPSDAKKGVATGSAPVTKGKDGKSKGANIVASKDDDDTEGKDTNTKESKDTFASLWGSSSKKTSGKKGDEAKNKIGKEDWSNQKASVNIGAWNEPELTDIDDQPSALPPAKSSKSAMSTAKGTSNKSSVLQRVKELEKNKAAEFIPEPPSPDLEPTSKPDKKGASNKTKEVTASKSVATKKKDLLAQSVDKKKGLKDSVPGSFPGEGEGMDDDFGDLVDSPPIEKQESKGSKKGVKPTKDPKVSSKTRDTPESKRPPTPPPEPKEEKPVKKERPRVVKAGGASSWGMWGAAAPAKDKKTTKSKDDADVSPPPKKEKTAAPGLVRSKSTKTAKEKDRETVRSDPKSSDSDKPKKTESRPPKSRGSSFGAFFGAPPARTKSVRRNSTATSGPKMGSRRPSMDVDATGLPSPPAEDTPNVGTKAAKVMGVGGSKLDRKASTKGKQKVSAAPDPYAIDSDDMVMVNGLDDPIINAPIPKNGKSKGSKGRSKEVEPEPAPVEKDLPDRTRSKRESKMDSSRSKRQSKAFYEDEDVVMVDDDPLDEPEVADGPDDMQFITKPKGLQRSSTASKKPESKMGGLFGAFRKSRPAADNSDRPKSKGIVEDEVSPRKRTVTGGDDTAKRPRRDDRRRSEKTTSRAAEGYVYNTEADGVGATEAEDADARKEERKAKRAEKDRAAREAESLKYEADRRTKRRTAEKEKVKEQDRKARKVEEAETRAQEDREARRAARRARDEEQANRELEEDILKRKRRDTDKDAERSSRPGKTDRRRSHYDKPISSQAPDEEEARRARRDDRRAKADRRKSTAAPVDDYFDPRNGKRGANNANNDPYGGGGNDHTASWVESLAKDSPDAPPLEPTIMEPAPDLRPNGSGGGGPADDLLADEDVRRSSKRKSKRSSRMYADPVLGGEGDGYRSPPPPTSRRQSDGLGGVKLGVGSKTFDGKTGSGKRSSWFQKIGGRL